MDRLSPLALAAIAFIVMIGFLVNMWLVALLRNKDWRDPQILNRRMPKRGPGMADMQKFVRLVRDPFSEEKNQLDQLSKLVQDLKDKEGQK
jgi:hypothetical protein